MSKDSWWWYESGSLGEHETAAQPGPETVQHDERKGEEFTETSAMNQIDEDGPEVAQKTDSGDELKKDGQDPEKESDEREHTTIHEQQNGEDGEGDNTSGSDETEKQRKEEQTSLGHAVREKWLKDQKDAIAELKAKLCIANNLVLKALKLWKSQQANKGADAEEGTQTATATPPLAAATTTKETTETEATAASAATETAASAVAAAETAEAAVTTAPAATAAAETSATETAPAEPTVDEKLEWANARKAVEAALCLTNKLLRADEDVLRRSLKSHTVTQEIKKNFRKQTEDAVLGLANKDAVAQATRDCLTKLQSDVEEREKRVAHQQKEVDTRAEQRDRAVNEYARARAERRVLGAQKKLERLKKELEVAILATEQAEKAASCTVSEVETHEKPEEDEDEDDEDEPGRGDKPIKHELVAASLLWAHESIRGALLFHKRVVEARAQLNSLGEQQYSQSAESNQQRKPTANKEAVKQARAMMANARTKVQSSTAGADIIVQAIACSATEFELVARLAVLRRKKELEKNQQIFKYVVSDLKRESIKEEEAAAAIKKREEAVGMSKEDQELAEQQKKLEAAQKKQETLRNAYQHRYTKQKNKEMRIAQLEAAMSHKAREKQEIQVKKSKTTTTDESFMVDEHGRLMRIVTTTVVRTTVVITPVDDGTT